MRAVILQHHPIEGPGSLTPWLRCHAATTTIVHLYLGETCPDPGDVDLLIILGGPMNVDEVQEFPWLIKEKAFIRAVVDGQTPVLGICLGAQLIASALGAAVRANPEKEIGWLAINGIAAAGGDFAIPSLEVFQWHGDTFDLPSGAVLLATSAACRHQAFLYQEKVLGLQFHLEATPELVRLFIATGAEELVLAPSIQTAAAILGAPKELYPAGNQLLERLLHRLLS